jgi:hypothetical protein
MAAFRNYEAETNTELICVEFSNSVQRPIFISYLSCYYFIKVVFNIRDSNTAAEKYSTLYRPINLSVFRICNMV